MRDAAEGSRREHKRRERGRNPQRPRDFAAHEPPRANGRSPMAERRTSVNRSPCGRRTSLPAVRISASRLADSIPAAGRRFQRNSRRKMKRRLKDACQIDLGWVSNFLHLVVRGQHHRRKRHHRAVRVRQHLVHRPLAGDRCKGRCPLCAQHNQVSLLRADSSRAAPRSDRRRPQSSAPRRCSPSSAGISSRNSASI